MTFFKMNFSKIQLALLLVLSQFSQPIFSQKNSAADSLRLAARSGADTSRIFAYSQLVNDFVIFEDVELANRLLDTAEILQKNLPEGAWTAKLQLARGYYFQVVGKYQQAFDENLKALKIAEKLGNSELMCDANYGLAAVMFEQNRFAEGIAYQEKSVEFARKSGNSSKITQGLCNLAGFYYSMPELKNRVLPTMEEALAFAYKSDSAQAKIILLNLVGMLTDEGKTAEARSNLLKFKGLVERGSEAVDRAHVPFLEALILQREGRDREAIPLFEQALAAFQNVGSLPRIKSVFFSLKKSLVAVGDFRRAFEVQQSYQILQDSIFKVEQTRSLDEVQTKFETEKKEAQIAAQQQEITRANREKWALLAGLAVFGLLSFLLFRQRQKTKAANLELAASNSEISRQNQKLDLLMRELHHRVKNNLQLVGSLLRLQGRRVQDAGAAGAIREGQLRVEAMSLIHSRLYRTEGLTTVEMNDFSSELCEKIAYSFGFAPDAFDASISFVPAELDVDKAMPIGLILNELITNSFKYAFAETARPRLQISFSKNENGQSRLHFSDNGSGRAEGSKSSFGTQLIQSLSGQLEGESRFWNEGGLHFELVFAADEK